MSFTDADLIARVLLHEDQNAFCELVRRYQSPLRGFLTKLANGDTHRADDLAQETFIRAWKKLNTFRGQSRFTTWLFGIAFNNWRMDCRGRTELALEDVEEPPPEPAQVDAAATSSARLDLADVFKVLTAAERAAIVLCCQNGLTHEEAALVLECPVGTVKTHVLRGKEKLRRQLSL